MAKFGSGRISGIYVQTVEKRIAPPRTCIPGLLIFYSITIRVYLFAFSIQPLTPFFMKKLLTCCAALLVFSASFSQTRFGVKGGLNLANQKLTVSLLGIKASQAGDGIASFHVGGVLEVPIVANKLFFRPELLVSGKGSNFNFESETTEESSELELRPLYLELPLNLVYSHELKGCLRLFAGAGPSLAYGIGGKAKAEGTSSNFFDAGVYKRFDFGINFLAGVELSSGLTIGINITNGLADILDSGFVSFLGETEDLLGGSMTWKNHSVVGISIGYMFGR
jgi:hypothetical protein